MMTIPEEFMPYPIGFVRDKAPAPNDDSKPLTIPLKYHVDEYVRWLNDLRDATIKKRILEED